MSDDRDVLDGAVVTALRSVATSTLANALAARSLRHTVVAGVVPRHVRRETGTSMVGPAYTLRHIPAREDLDLPASLRRPDHPHRVAIEAVPAGAVLVMDCRGRRDAAVLGGILATRLAVRGVEGVVTDGAVRDLLEVADLGLAVYSAGVSPAPAMVRHHAVEAQVPVGCGEVAVYPGDVIVGDADGVVCIPRHLAADVARDAVEREHLEEFVSSEIRRGVAVPGLYPPGDEARRRYETWASDHPLSPSVTGGPAPRPVDG